MGMTKVESATGFAATLAGFVAGSAASAFGKYPNHQIINPVLLGLVGKAVGLYDKEKTHAEFADAIGNGALLAGVGTLLVSALGRVGIGMTGALGSPFRNGRSVHAGFAPETYRYNYGPNWT